MELPLRHINDVQLGTFGVAFIVKQNTMRLPKIAGAIITDQLFFLNQHEFVWLQSKHICHSLVFAVAPVGHLFLPLGVSKSKQMRR